MYICEAVMAINFPNKQEVKLRNSPLNEVICQVKFPPIFRITKDIPYEFQEAIRDRFPKYSLEKAVLLGAPDSKEIGSSEVEAILRTHRFKTYDEKTNVGISADFFALSTSSYSHWQNFIQELDKIQDSIINIYQPAYATRIGLRFINKFTNENSKTNDANELRQLFREELTCLLETNVWNDPNEFATQISLSDGSDKLTLRVHYGKEEGQPFIVLDLDHYEEGQIPFDILLDRIHHYHQRIYDAFRWCLIDEALDRFVPIQKAA
jgi:uncharacterized protein (TIGR04255 family)